MGVELWVSVALPGWREGTEAAAGRGRVDGLVASVGVVECAAALGRGRLSLMGRESTGWRVVDDFLLPITRIGGIAWIAWIDGILIAAPAAGIEELRV